MRLFSSLFAAAFGVATLLAVMPANAGMMHMMMKHHKKHHHHMMMMMHH